MSSKRREVPEERRRSRDEPPGRPYRRPELQEYGSLKQLTRTLSFDLPGDILATSFVN